MAKSSTSWTKGQSGNPAGSQPGPRRPTFKSLCEKIKKRGITWQHPDYGIIDDPLECALVMTFSAAMNGESWACRELLAYGLGRPPVSIEVDSEHPLAIIWRDWTQNGKNGGNGKKLLPTNPTTGSSKFIDVEPDSE